MGETFLAAHVHRAVAPADPPEVRALVWHLTAAGLADPEARAWVAEDGGYVRDLLRWMYWHRTELGGRSSPAPGAQPTRSWAAWLRTGWKQRWAFEDERFRAWVQRVVGGGVPAALRNAPMRDDDRRLGGPATPPVSTPAPGRAPIPSLGDEPAPDPRRTVTWPDDVWGRAAAAFAEENQPAALMWLVDSTLVEETDTAVVVRARDVMAADHLDTRLRSRLEAILRDLRGRPTALQVVRHVPPDLHRTPSA
jgi:hypothetical protein